MYAQSTSLQKGYKEWYIGDFRCGVYIPPSYDPKKKYPVVVYLHGKNDTLTRKLGWYQEPAALADPPIVLTPKCPLSETGEWGNSESEEVPPIVKQTLQMIELVKKQYNPDEDRFYIYSIYMGAIGTFGIIDKFPQMYAGGYAVCCWGDAGFHQLIPNLRIVWPEAYGSAKKYTLYSIFYTSGRK